MSKFVIFVFSLFLLLSAAVSIRPEPTIPHTTQQPGLGGEEIDESCENLNEEECLMRRTLVAHTDYIYTQKHNKP
ncbi:hypothetical protein AMTRI_Chr12g272540 [Amborella trichopoda]|uniref:Phytosulfokine n=1 Tax=Amborella trichopoda TaxID=13333 RepID=U5CZ13_AMBTC|nr:hypothetical protein AMTR_s00065p00113250 [Amborella trichopoda]